MKSKWMAWAAVFALILLLAAPLLAHHGTAEFDQTKSATVKGTVTDFIWTNPHGSIELDVPGPSGSIEKWMAVLTSPNFLARAGWNKNTLKPGDEVTITGNVAKRHANTLRVTRIQLANGRELPLGLEN